MTVMRAALEKAGYTPREYALGAAIKMFVKAGGDVQTAHALVDETFSLRSAAKGMVPSNGHCSVAGAPQFNSRGAAIVRVPSSGQTSPSVASGNSLPGAADVLAPSNGPGVPAVARQNPSGSAASKLPPSNGQSRPAASPRPLDRQARRAVELVAARTVLDSYKIDGRAIGDYSIGEAKSLMRKYGRYSYVFREIVHIVANAPDHAMIRDVAKVNEVERIIQKAAEYVDAL